MKFVKTKSVSKWIMTSVLGGALTMGFGAASAFADDGVTFAPATGSAETAATDAGAAVTAPPVAAEQSPESWMTPSEFIAFLKTVVQKIEITLTVDDADRAKLLTAITQERIRESDEMLAEGKTEQAAEALQKALSDHELAIEITVRGEDAKGEDSESDQKELTEQYRHNIEALTKALEKVKNPTAKAAIARNIAKTKAKLSAKLGLPAEVAVSAVPASQPSADAESAHQEAVHEAEHEVEFEAEHEGDDHEDADHDDADHEDADHQDADHQDADHEGGDHKHADKEAAKELREKIKEERKAAHEKGKEERESSHGHGRKNH
ncbi:hypothetical protein GE107_05920 [Cohnella sp. CFH 77786]|uniref:DUF5667 domain-containing protein n=1 Tax=Cohnella sp. CFH 77786 TaxID=2662265 RepID=UPI001C60FD50|nr:DUF5667 domain-containing protein [Cohnella sp. CFH 77786]MBW5445599.1 hypothetical protein [Cohnella sp. CFH 77786]